MTDAIHTRVRYVLMELGHADVLGRFKTLRAARIALAGVLAVASVEESNAAEFGIVEFDEAGHPVGEVIR